MEKPDNRGSIKLLIQKMKENKLGVAVRSIVVVVGGGAQNALLRRLPSCALFSFS
jgi:hypothetical protein